MPRIITPVVGAIASALLLGCGFGHLKADLHERDHVISRISGSVVAEGGTDHTLVVAVVTDVDGVPGAVRVVDFVRLPRPGAFDFILEPGTYRLAAFEDADENLDYSAMERADGYRKFAPFALTEGERLEDVRLVIVDPAEPEEVPRAIERPAQPIRSVEVGDVVPLEAERFSREAARIGVWRPVRFMRRYGAGLFFVEPHRPGRISVIFVHGFGGYPQEFVDLIAGLDTERFEAVVASYPSGWRLGEVAAILSRSIGELEARYGLETTCVVGHSMGGLVSREALSIYFEREPRPKVRALVTLASPLGGMPAAASGVANAPVVVPSWRDLSPQSDYVTSLYRRPLPDAFEYRLAFGYDGESDGDGTVPVLSQLRREAQTEARHVRGFHTTHAGILRDDGARAFVYRSLDACAARQSP